jgi:hypothetical protein
MNLHPWQTLDHVWILVLRTVKRGLDHNKPSATTCAEIWIQYQMSGDDRPPAATTETMNLRTNAIQPSGPEVFLPDFEIGPSWVLLE